MAKKELAKAYIESGRIKIVDSSGCEYQKEINDTFRKAKKKQTQALILMCLSLFCLGFTISNFLFSWMSVSQTAVAGVLGVFLGIVSADKSSDKENLEEGANEYLNEYNLARHELQNQVLELEKVLAQHTKDINNLRLNNVMDFSENFKKKEKQTAYM